MQRPCSFCEYCWICTAIPTLQPKLCTCHTGYCTSMCLSGFKWSITMTCTSARLNTAGKLYWFVEVLSAPRQHVCLCRARRLQVNYLLNKHTYCIVGTRLHRRPRIHIHRSCTEWAGRFRIKYYAQIQNAPKSRKNLMWGLTRTENQLTLQQAILAAVLAKMASRSIIVQELSPKYWSRLTLFLWYVTNFTSISHKLSNL